MSEFKKLSDQVFVSRQITVADVEEAKRLGVTLIINNRPDGEEPGQPTAAEIGAAAKAAGIDYRTVPVDHSGFRPEQVAAMGEALDGASGPVLAFCRSGMRSTALWALSQRGKGADGAALMSSARNAGYDLSSISGALTR
ncbi:TIGR01244 family sulfur transferase [Sphingomonas quercus]|uniref:TIGR01244 family phosphatase n=1 Tax=Sphingomonas quercus TaxID=2842451 RepID=A0ABS6BFL6_9SPHN|nr:TIGR01244 family sulfur transferase [Sphingomonas quercus]MBU3077085.1 TIGR01244 family phosphatase [Sphingomonas quercus]